MAECSFIGLHAGAHFAGSETFNRYMAANHAAIEAAGLASVTPQSPFDAGWTDAPLPEAGTAVADLPGFAAALTAAIRPVTGPGMRGLVLSRPDLAGSVAEVVSGSFFQSAGLRATALRLALGRPVDTLVFAIQPYDLFFLSAWRRAAMEGEIAPFDRHTRAMARFSGGWVETIEALADALGAGRVVVTASAPQDLRAYLPRMLPGVALEDTVMPEPAAPVTDSAIAMFQRHRRMGTRFAPGQRERLLAFHARLPQSKPRSGFDWLPLADMRGRYVGDLDLLARMAGVEVAGSPIAAIAAE